jgi:Helix-turn-helix domain
MRGRQPVGPELAERVAGSDEARRRAKVVLQTMTGELRVQEACARLGISEQRFEAIRQEAIAGAVASLEPKPVGRPPRPAASADAAEVARLRERIAELEAEVHAAAVRLELAAALPRVGRDAGKT